MMRTGQAGTWSSIDSLSMGIISDYCELSAAMGDFGLKALHEHCIIPGVKTMESMAYTHAQERNALNLHVVAEPE